MNIEQQIDALIKREGGYVDHPNDRGGPTRFGITEQKARAHGYTGSMRDFPEDWARRIYREDYWTAPGFDQVAAVDSVIADELLDTGVNMGPQVAGRMLQRALNVFNVRETRYPDIAVDGAIGKMTVFALREFLKFRGNNGRTVMLRALNGQQGVRYIEIAERNKTQEDFTFGWFLHRVQ